MCRGIYRVSRMATADTLAAYPISGASGKRPDPDLEEKAGSMVTHHHLSLALIERYVTIDVVEGLPLIYRTLPDRVLESNLPTAVAMGVCLCTATLGFISQPDRLTEQGIGS